MISRRLQRSTIRSVTRAPPVPRPPPPRARPLLTPRQRASTLCPRRRLCPRPNARARCLLPQQMMGRNAAGPGPCAVPPVCFHCQPACCLSAGKHQGQASQGSGPGHGPSSSGQHREQQQWATGYGCASMCRYVVMRLHSFSGSLTTIDVPMPQRDGHTEGSCIVEDRGSS